MKIYVWFDAYWRDDYTPGGVAICAESVERAKIIALSLGGFYRPFEGEVTRIEQVPEPTDIFDPSEEAVILDVQGGG